MFTDSPTPELTTANVDKQPESIPSPPAPGAPAPDALIPTEPLPVAPLPVPTNLSDLHSNDLSPQALSLELDSLTPQEAAAMEILLNGGTITAAARAASISRSTLYQWLQANTHFANTYYFWKRGMNETTRTRLLMLAENATNNIATAIKRGDEKISLKLLTGMGILAAPSVGPSLPQIQAQRAQAKADKAYRDSLDPFTRMRMSRENSSPPR